MVTKIIEERGHLDEDVLTLAMTELRNTPGPFGVSSATIVYGYELRSLLPVIERRDAEATKRKEYYDKGVHGLKPLNVEDKAVVQHEETKRWDRKGSIIEKGDHRKYLIKLDNGRRIWRNWRFLSLNHEVETHINLWRRSMYDFKRRREKYDQKGSSRRNF